MGTLAIPTLSRQRKTWPVLFPREARKGRPKAWAVGALWGGFGRRSTRQSNIWSLHGPCGPAAVFRSRIRRGSRRGAQGDYAPVKGARWHACQPFHLCGARTSPWPLLNRSPRSFNLAIDHGTFPPTCHFAVVLRPCLERSRGADRRGPCARKGRPPRRPSKWLQGRLPGTNRSVSRAAANARRKRVHG